MSDRITDYESFRAAVEDKLASIPLELDPSRFSQKNSGVFLDGVVYALQAVKSRIELWDAYDEQP